MGQYAVSDQHHWRLRVNKVTARKRIAFNVCGERKLNSMLLRDPFSGDDVERDAELELRLSKRPGVDGDDVVALDRDAEAGIL